MNEALQGGRGSPMVSIGMPLYNEETHLRQSLDSLLAQDFTDFELIISDNASEDSTQKICLAYVAQDARIRYCGNQVNLGSTENFNRAFRLSSGKYFMWASGHDLWAPTFLSRCVEVLERDPSVVLCYPQSIVIDGHGKKVEVVQGAYLDSRNLGLVLRVTLAICGAGSAYMIYGVIGHEALAQTRLFRRVMEPEYVLLTELSVLGSFAQVPEALFYIRLKWGTETKRQWTTRAFEAMNPSTKPQHIRFPYLGWIREELLAVKDARLDRGRKAVLMACVVLGYFSRYRVHLPLTLHLALRGLLRRLGIKV